jgi:hypothetical protein
MQPQLFLKEIMVLKNAAYTYNGYCHLACDRDCMYKLSQWTSAQIFCEMNTG